MKLFLISKIVIKRKGEKMGLSICEFIGAEIAAVAICFSCVWAFCMSLRKIGSTDFIPGKETAFWIFAVTSLANIVYPPAMTLIGIFCLSLLFVSIPVALFAGPIKRRRKNSPTKSTEDGAGKIPPHPLVG